MKLRILLAILALSCAEPAREEAEPVQGTIRLDREGFHGEGFDNEWTLSSNEDVVVRLETPEAIANFSVPDHDLQAIVSRSRPGILRFRALPCTREGGCHFRVVTVIGAGDAVSEGTLHIESLETHDEPPRGDGASEGSTAQGTKRAPSEAVPSE